MSWQEAHGRPSDDDFVQVHIEEEESDELTEHEFDSNVDWDEPMWPDPQDGGPTGGQDNSRTYEEVVQEFIDHFIQYMPKMFGALRPKPIGWSVPGHPLVPCRSSSLSSQSLGYHLHPAVSHLLTGEGKQEGPEPRVKNPPKFKPAPPSLGEKRRPDNLERATGNASMLSAAVPAASPSAQRGATSKAPSATAETIFSPYFDEESVDWGGEDDRTAEEKAEDEEILNRTRENIVAFMQATPEVKKQLRTNAWKRCVDRLWDMRINLEPHFDKPHPGKFQEDLAAGYSFAEAKDLQKQRDRAARHHGSLAHGRGDIRGPTLRTSEKPKKVLMPGFLKAKGEKRAQGRAEKWKTSTSGRATEHQGKVHPSALLERPVFSQPLPPNTVKGSRHPHPEPTTKQGAPFRSSQTSWDWSSWQWSWNSWDYRRAGYRWQADPPRGDLPQGRVNLAHVVLFTNHTYSTYRELIS